MALILSTRQLGYQVEVFSKEEALEYFKDSNYEDCRIKAYPSFTEYHGINRTPISFLMVDLDLKDFADEIKRAKAVLQSIEQNLAEDHGISRGKTNCIMDR
jgi:hypothetical protein